MVKLTYGLMTVLLNLLLVSKMSRLLLALFENHFLLLEIKLKIIQEIVGFLFQDIISTSYVLLPKFDIFLNIIEEGFPG